MLHRSDKGTQRHLHSTPLQSEVHKTRHYGGKAPHVSSDARCTDEAEQEVARVGVKKRKKKDPDG